MSMARKDFEVIADALFQVVKRAEDIGLEVYRTGYRDGAVAVMREFVRIAKVSNPGLDVEWYPTEEEDDDR